MAAVHAAKRVCRGLATVACAPSKNLNVGFPHFATARELYDHIRAISKNESKEFVVRNFVGVIEDVSVAASTVETACGLRRIGCPLASHVSSNRRCFGRSNLADWIT